MPQTKEIKYDVIIVGAGPAGCTCALALKQAGLKVALLDKATFPRDKVCGDAIPGRAIKTLNSIDPAFGAAFGKFPAKCATKTATIYYKGKAVSFSWVLDAYTCKRMEFDNFLFGLVNEHTDTDVLLNTRPDVITEHSAGVSVSLKGSDTMLHTSMIIGADGAHSTVAKQLTTNTMRREHHAGSVRAYYSNMSGMQASNIEIYFDKCYLPSYLWVFPLPGNTANVGFGMLSSEIAKRKANIKHSFYEFLSQSTELKDKFTNARPAGELEGFGLPLGSGIATLSGAHFMLTGDAASLIDPISGDGIGNAMLSGKLAAEHVIKCFRENNFTGDFMKGYDKAVLGRLGKELRLHHRAQQWFGKMPFLLDIVFLACRNKHLKKLIQKGL